MMSKLILCLGDERQVRGRPCCPSPSPNQGMSGQHSASDKKVLHAFPGTAGDGLKYAAFIPLTRVIVNDHRWQASSHRGPRPHRKTVGASLLAMDSSAPRLSRPNALSLTTIAGKPAPTKDRAHAETVGASLLAMNSSTPRLSRSHALSLANQRLQCPENA